MKTITTSLYLGMIALSFGFTFNTASAHDNPNHCVSGILTLAQTKYAITRGGFGDGVILGTRNPANGLVEIDARTGNALITNDTNCALPISIASYTLDNPSDADARYQTFYAASPANTLIPPKSSRTLHVNLPPCNFQADFFYGDKYTRPKADRYVKSEFFLEAGYILNRTAAGGFPCPTASPTPTPAPTPSPTPTPTPTYTPSGSSQSIYYQPQYIAPPQPQYVVLPQYAPAPQYVELTEMPYTGLSDYPLIPLYTAAFVFWTVVLGGYAGYRKMRRVV